MCRICFKYCLTLQLEQEIDLILEKKGILSAAEQDWSTKWVPAILEYSSTFAGKKATVLSEARKAYEGDYLLMHNCA